MSKIGLIIKREYLRRVSKKSFILLTFLTPFLFAALAFVPLWLSSIKGDEVHTVAILDATGKYAPLFEDTESYRFINGDKDMETRSHTDGFGENNAKCLKPKGICGFVPDSSIYGF